MAEDGSRRLSECIRHLDRWLSVNRLKLNERIGVPELIPVYLAVSPQVTKAINMAYAAFTFRRDVVTFQAAGYHRPLTVTKLYC